MMRAQFSYLWVARCEVPKLKRKYVLLSFGGLVGVGGKAQT